MSNHTSNSIGSSIVFIDAAVANRKSLLKDLRPGTEVVLLNSKQDGIEQITAALQGRSNIQSLQIISHGEPGTVYLGSTQLNSATLDRYRFQLEQWKSSLTENADLFLYGCNVADNGTPGKGFASNFLKDLSRLTGADVAASNDLTGAQGDWDLEMVTGKVTTPPVLNPAATAHYKGNLGTITVTSTANSGAGTLRDALARAQAGDTITFASTLANKKITLTSGHINITKNVTIDASAAPGLVLSGNKASRVFFVSETNLNVTIKKLKFIDGKATGTNVGENEGGAIKVRDYSTLTVENSSFQFNNAGRGGAIRVGYGGSLIVRNSTFDSNNGTLANDGFSAGAIATYGAGGSTGKGRLVIEGSTFTNNKGVVGGAVYNLLGPVSIKNSVFKNNQSTREGGALFTDGVSGSNKDTTGGTLTITGSRFEGNRSVGGGGGLYLWTHAADSVLIKDSTIMGNAVTRGGTYNLGRGGGIEFAGSNLTIDKTTIANNISPVQGGGLWVNNNVASTTIVNSTFSGNQATEDAGGGMFLGTYDRRPVTITNTSIVNNLAGRDAGGIWTGGANSDDVKLTNTIFAGNTATATKQGHANFTMAEGGGNVIQTIVGGRGPVVTRSSRYVPDLKLSGLQLMGNDYVHSLLSGSPAINAGTTTGAPVSDQRSMTRDSKPDAGAFEFGASTITALSRTTRTRSANGLRQQQSKQRPLQSQTKHEVLLGRSSNTLLHNSQDALLEGGKPNRKFMAGKRSPIQAGSGSDLLKQGRALNLDFNEAPFRGRSSFSAVQPQQLGTKTVVNSGQFKLENFDRPLSFTSTKTGNSAPLIIKNSFL